MTELEERIGVNGSYPGMDLFLFFMIVGEEFQTCAVFSGSGVTDWKDRVVEKELERTGLESGSNESPGDR